MDITPGLSAGLFAGIGSDSYGASAEAYIYAGVTFRAQAKVSFRYPKPLAALDDCDDGNIAWCSSTCKEEHDLEVWAAPAL